MFSPKQKLNGAGSVSGNTSIIAAGLKITGEVITDADIRIDGTLIGNISSSAKVVIGPEGYVEGNITAQQVDTTGKINGNITVRDLLNMREKAELYGDINALKISIEPTVYFNGKCSMSSGTQVVEITYETNERQAKAK